MINEMIKPFLGPADLIQGYLMDFIFSWGAIVLAIGVSFLTVIISVWLPAKKASNVFAINTVRGIGEVRIKNKKVRGGGVVKKAFGFEGVLARTFLKRSKRNFRATVIAMSFSVAIFIMAGGLFDQMMRFAELQWGGVEANVSLMVWIDPLKEVDCAYFRNNMSGRIRTNEMGEEECARAIEGYSSTTAAFQDLSVSISEHLNDGDRIVGIGYGFRDYRVTLDYSELGRHMPMLLEEWLSSGFTGSHRFRVRFVVVNEEFANELALLAGVPKGSNILVNHTRSWTNDNRVVESEIMNFDYQTLEITGWSSVSGSVTKEIELHGQLTADTVPAELSNHSWQDEFLIIVPEIELIRMEWWIKTEDSARIVDVGELLIPDLLSEVEEEMSQNFTQEGIEYSGLEGGYFIVTDMDAMEASVRNTMGLAMFFVFAFVGALILIGLTNVISTTFENVKTRAVEFAVLQSVGMTSGGIKQMLNLESVFSSARALIIGVPLGLMGHYGIYIAMSNMWIFDFSIPWRWVIASVVAVFLLTWLTMRYAAGRLKNQNIIETIRSGSGM